MRVLVLSDSHGNSRVLRQVVAYHSDIASIVFLGDVTDDILDLQQAYPHKTWHIVSGNCDGFCLWPRTTVFEVEGRRILATHGHRFRVKYGTEDLARFAREQGCTVALYGHTHVAHTAYEEGLYLVNPGSVGCPREGGPSYAVVDVLPAGVVTTLMDPRRIPV